MKTESKAPLLSIDPVKFSRTYCFDVLRTFASLAVVFIHVCAKHWKDIPLDSSLWMPHDIYDSIVRWAVPIFVMISGALFLGRGLDIKTILKKYVLRIGAAYLFWASAYALVNVLTKGSDLVDVIAQMISPPMHMWFLIMIPGLYIIVPLLDKIIESPKLTKYFLLLALLFTFVIPFIIFHAKELYPKLGDILSATFDDTHFHLTGGYAFYFVAGYVLAKTELSKKFRLCTYILGIIAAGITILGTRWISLRHGELTTSYYSNFCILVMLQSVAVFVFAKQNLHLKNRGSGAKKAFALLSKYSFGVYLVHLMVLDQLDAIFGISSVMCNPYIAIPAVSIIVYAVSLGISAIFNNIPLVKRYIV